MLWRALPPRLVNNLLQRNMAGASRELARFSLNLSMGILGFFDVATELGIAKSDADAGQTLAFMVRDPVPTWSCPSSRR
jgi:ABC-type transporter lipoprotein component MlaA